MLVTNSGHGIPAEAPDAVISAVREIVTTVRNGPHLGAAGMATVEREFLAAPERVPTFDVTGWVLRISLAVLFLGSVSRTSTQIPTGYECSPTSDSGTGSVI